MTHNLVVENIKCGGCANSIMTNLSKLKGVHKVTLDITQGCIQVDTDDLDTVETVLEKLHHMVSSAGQRVWNDHRYILYQLFDRESDFVIGWQIWKSMAGTIVTN
ncbi:MAG: heavy metal-associated domain-containing protein [Saprospiraceae bacterium]|nr:heavy metal-associated domain-containing protein [Saprospiraceae bacterium]